MWPSSAVNIAYYVEASVKPRRLQWFNYSNLTYKHRVRKVFVYISYHVTRVLLRHLSNILNSPDELRKHIFVISSQFTSRQSMVV